MNVEKIRVVVSRLLVGLTCLVALLASGCAFSSALERGDGHASTGDWARAVDSYESAVREQPESTIALQKLDEARQEGALDEVERGREALEGRRWREALESAEAAREFVPESAEARALEGEIRGQMLETISSVRSREQSWHLALEAIALFPRDADISAALDDARNKLVFEAMKQGDEGRYALAISEIERIVAREPHTRARFESELSELRRKQAALFRADAKRASKEGHLGAAFVFYAKAAEVYGDPTDRAERDRLRAELIERGSRGVSLEIGGDGVRAREMEARVRAWVRSTRGLELATRARDARIEVTIEMDKVACRQSAVEHVGSVRYVAGTKQIRNPDWASRQKELLDREDDLTRLERRELEAIEALDRADKRIERAWRREFSLVLWPP